MADDLLETTDEVVELTLEETSWAAPPGVTRHAGVAIEPDQDFFADPAPEIGTVLTADTTLNVTQKPWRTSTRIAIAGLVGWAGSMALNFSDLSDVIVEALVFAVLAILVWFLTRFSHTCSFVGTNGACRFSCKGNRSQARLADLFLFDEAAELRTSQTRHYHNGIYTGTNYSFAWTDHDGKKRFKLSGTYRGEKKPPKPKDPFHFAVMTETAWSLYILARMTQDMEETGEVRFPLSGNGWVAVGKGYLLVSQKRQVDRLGAGDIGEVSIDSGVVKIKRVDAKEGWFSSTGVYKFPYDSMANFQAFSQAYTRWVVNAGDSSPSAKPAS